MTPNPPYPHSPTITVHHFSSPYTQPDGGTNTQTMNSKTALLITALMLATALTAACGTARNGQEPTAPKTAQCLSDHYWAYQSESSTDSRVFATVTCSNSAAVQAELQQIAAAPEHAQECQKRERSNVPENFPRELKRVYAAMICIR